MATTVEVQQVTCLEGNRHHTKLSILHGGDIIIDDIHDIGLTCMDESRSSRLEHLTHILLTTTAVHGHTLSSASEY